MRFRVRERDIFHGDTRVKSTNTITFGFAR
jgi:hypothetical protein